ncbi:MAG: sigma-70 family RNA polymerase sigma factor [Firmicutes bacterium]|jgi:RNA polymerase sigma-70 factor (ECF subfamily)|nr:sigma-70 family RNA polymerase sigma factor [Bacillota bacterium]
MKAVQLGRWDAFHTLYRVYSAGVYQLARRRLNDGRLAEDVVQDVFLRVWCYADRWDPARGSVDTWILVIARHVIYDYLRRAERQRTLEVTEEAILALADPGDEMLQLVEHENIRTLLSALPPEQREVVRLVYGEGLSTQEIAAQLRVPLGTVKSRLRLALRRLRRQLQEEARSNGAL